MLRYFTAGASHGPCFTMIIDGVPTGFPIDVAKVNHDLWRRQQGYGRCGGTVRGVWIAELSVGAVAA